MKLAKISLAIFSLVLILGVCPSVQAAEEGADVDLSATVPLTISDVSASSIGYYGATISWETNGNATSQVFYDTESRGKIADYANRTIEETTRVNEHSTTLTGLSSSTTYHYRVKSVATIDTIVFVAISDDDTFKTLTPVGGGGGGGGAGPDTTPPVISSICLCPEGATETTADICWTTNEMSTSQVEYWTSPSLLSPLDETFVIEHHVHLSGLTPGTTYHYKTMSRDAAGNLAVSDVYAFTTLPGVAIFTASKLSISPGEVNIGEAVTISVVITNTGDGAGSYKVVLKTNGVVEATKDITLNAGASEEVTFSAAKDVAGSYSVEVDGLSGSFTVREKPPPPTVPPPEEVPPAKPLVNWPLIGGIIAGVVIVGLGVFFWMRRRAA